MNKSQRAASTIDNIKYPEKTLFFGLIKSDRKKSIRLISSIDGYHLAVVRAQ